MKKKATRKTTAKKVAKKKTSRPETKSHTDNGSNWETYKFEFVQDNPKQHTRDSNPVKIEIMDSDRLETIRVLAGAVADLAKALSASPNVTVSDCTFTGTYATAAVEVKS